MSLPVRIPGGSQDDFFPIDRAFGSTAAPDGRAGIRGTQLIQVPFHEAQPLRTVQIHFIKRASEAMQELLRFAETDRLAREVRWHELETNPHRAMPALHNALYVTLAGTWLNVVAPAS